MYFYSLIFKESGWCWQVEGSFAAGLLPPDIKVDHKM